MLLLILLMLCHNVIDAAGNGDADRVDGVVEVDVDEVVDVSVDANIVYADANMLMLNVLNVGC